jgi:hypothetical protein
MKKQKSWCKGLTGQAFKKHYPNGMKGCFKKGEPSIFKGKHHSEKTKKLLSENTIKSWKEGKFDKVDFSAAQTPEKRKKHGETISKYMQEGIRYKNQSNKIKQLWSQDNSPYKNIPQIVSNNWKKGKYNTERMRSTRGNALQKQIWLLNPSEKKSVLVKSKLEQKYGLLLNDKNVKWQYEPKTFSLSNGKNVTFDFYLPRFNEWHELKGNPTLSFVEKLKVFKKDYPHEKVIVLNQDLN